MDSNFYRRDLTNNRDRKVVRTHPDTGNIHPDRQSSISLASEQDSHRPRQMSHQSPHDQRVPPASPSSVPPRSRAATPAGATTFSTLPQSSKSPVADNAADQTQFIAKSDLTSQAAVKDPRLRRINTKTSSNSEAELSSPVVISSHPSTSTSIKPFTSPKHSPRDSAGAEASRSLQTTPLIERRETARPRSAQAQVNPILKQGSKQIESADVVMHDAVPESRVDNAVAQVLPSFESAQRNPDPNAGLLESFMTMMTNFAEEVSTTSAMKYEKRLLKQKAERFKRLDKQNRAQFADYPTTIEQGAKDKQSAEQELYKLSKNLKEQLKVQTELVQTIATQLVSQLSKSNADREIHPQQVQSIQKLSDQVNELAKEVTVASKDAREGRQMAQKSLKEAYEMLERSSSVGTEAQTFAQRSFAQVADLNVKIAANEQKTNQQISDIEGRVSLVQKNGEQAFNISQRAREDIANLARSVDADHDRSSKMDSHLLDLENDYSRIQKRVDKVEDNVDLVKGNVDRDRKTLNTDMNQLRKMQKDCASKFQIQEAALRETKLSHNNLASRITTLGKGAEQNARAPAPDTHITGVMTKVKEDVDTLRAELQILRETGIETHGKVLNEIQNTREELGEQEEELDKLHAGQSEYQNTFNGQIEALYKGLNKAEEDIQSMKQIVAKSNEDMQSLTTQLNSFSKKVENAVAATTARPTPPSAPPTPQMQQHAQFSARASSSPVLENAGALNRLNEMTAELHTVRQFVSTQFRNVANLPATLAALNQGVFNLEHRWNNLTTEPLVRAMAIQLQTMYPHASRAENEIRLLRSSIIKLEKLPDHVDSLGLLVNQHTSDIRAVNEKVDGEHKASGLRHDSLVSHVKSERDNVKMHLEAEHASIRRHGDERHEELSERIQVLKGKTDLQITQPDPKLTASSSKLAQTESRLTVIDSRLADVITKVKQLEHTSESRAVPSRPGTMSQENTLRDVSRGTPAESVREDLLKQFGGVARNNRPVTKPPTPVTYDLDDGDSDTPLVATRTHSARPGSTSSPSLSGRGTPATTRKRQRDAIGDQNDERKPLSEFGAKRKNIGPNA